MGLIASLGLTPRRSAAPPATAAPAWDALLAQLARAADKLQMQLGDQRSRLADQLAINKDQWLVAAASQAAGTVGRFFTAAFTAQEFHAVIAPDSHVWDAADAALADLRRALTRADAGAAGEALKRLAAEIGRVKVRIDEFLEGVSSGCENATAGLELTAAAGAVAATVATGGVAAGAGLGLMGTSAAVAVGAGAYGAAQEGTGQVTEVVIGTRQSVDLAAIAARAGKDAVIGFVGAFVGGALSKQFAKLFGSYLTQAINAEELAAIGKAVGLPGALPRDYFLTTGQRIVADFLAGAGTTPLTTAVSVCAARFGGQHAWPTADEFATLVLDEFTRGSILQVFLGAVLHGAQAGAKPGGKGGGKGKAPPHEPPPKPGADPAAMPLPEAVNDNVELPPGRVANDDVELHDGLKRAVGDDRGGSVVATRGGGGSAPRPPRLPAPATRVSGVADTAFALTARQRTFKKALWTNTERQVGAKLEAATGCTAQPPDSGRGDFLKTQARPGAAPVAVSEPVLLEQPVLTDPAHPTPTGSKPPLGAAVPDFLLLSPKKVEVFEVTMDSRFSIVPQERGMVASGTQPARGDAHKQIQVRKTLDYLIKRFPDHPIVYNIQTEGALAGEVREVLELELVIARRALQASGGQGSVQIVWRGAETFVFE